MAPYLPKRRLIIDLMVILKNVVLSFHFFQARERLAQIEALVNTTVFLIALF